MKVLLTGSSGQLAKEFIKRFSADGIDFHAPAENIFDIIDKDKVRRVFSEYKPDLLINCAAYNLVDEAQENPSKAFAVNRDAVETLALECRSTGAFMLHFGTDYIFDGRKNDLYAESDAPNPLNVYGRSKFEGELKAKLAGRSLILRLSWVIGEGAQNFLFKLKGWAAKSRVLKISADEVSVPTFTFDIVDVCMKALDSGLEGVYHLTNSGYASRYELARAYCSMKGMDNIIIPVPMASFKSKAERPLFTAMSNGLISSKLKTEIPHWQKSLEKYCKEYDE